MANDHCSCSAFLKCMECTHSRLFQLLWMPTDLQNLLWHSVLHPEIQCTLTSRMSWITVSAHIAKSVFVSFCMFLTMLTKRISALLIQILCQSFFSEVSRHAFAISFLLLLLTRLLDQRFALCAQLWFGHVASIQSRLDLYGRLALQIDRQTETQKFKIGSICE